MDKYIEIMKEKMPLIITGIILLACVIGIAFFIKWKMDQNTVVNNSNLNPAWYIGAADAKVTVDMFEEFQCPHCKEYTDNVQPKLVAEFEGKSVKFVYRHFPIFANSAEAAMASEIAGSQGKFWEYHDRLFLNQNKQPYNLATFLSIAGDLGLDKTKFEADYNSNKYKGDVNYDKNAGNDLKVAGTPSIFVNGKYVAAGNDQFASIRDAINAVLGKDATSSASSTSATDSTSTTDSTSAASTN